jgi:hypothetical protein|tara:strand:+ start:406 stop:717 length:312 start_codon:yes stop_codon:yes gene_type:complete
MIRLAFLAPQRKIIKFEIESKIVKYFDDNWQQGVQVMPKDQNLVEKLRRSGKVNLKMQAALIIDANKGKNEQEYLECTNDEEVAKVIRKDCKKKGLMEVSKRR